MALNQAQLMATPGGPGVTGSVKQGAGITIAPDGTVSLSTIGGTLVPGSYTNTNLTVDAYGRITVAANGAGPQSEFPAGTILPFGNAAAPTGWNKQTTSNDAAIRIVNTSGGNTGGTVGFSSAFVSQPVTGTISLSGLNLSGATTNTVNQTPSGSVSLSGLSVSNTSLSVGQIPGHTHGYFDNPNRRSSADGQSNRPGDTNSNPQTQATGGGGGHSHSVSGSGSFNGNNMSHSHSVSGDVSGAASFTGNSINLAVRYVDMILCAKI